MQHIFKMRAFAGNVPEFNASRADCIFSYLSPEARVRKDHPLRAIRAMVDEVLGQLSNNCDAGRNASRCSKRVGCRVSKAFCWTLR